MTSRKLVAGNWKMHGLSSDLAEIEEIARSAIRYPAVDVALCVPAILIERAARAVPGFPIGGQDVHHAEKGAHTGCVSAQMLLDAGAVLTIVGHSERRDAQRESDPEVKAKAQSALGCGLKVILCVGEILEVREQGAAVASVLTQIDGSLPEKPTAEVELAIAYEPVWAIGTGKNATPDDAAQVHELIRFAVSRRNVPGRLPILYGGSVNAGNVLALLARSELDGVLVGGASLDADGWAELVGLGSAA